MSSRLSELPQEEERDVVESYRLGVNSYTVKPVQFDAFMDTVAKIGLYWVLTNRVPQGR
jgi:two-component system, response regulator